MTKFISNSKFLISPLFMIFFLLLSVDADAQRKRKKRSDRNSDRNETRADGPSFSDRLVYEIGVGGLNFSGISGGGSRFSTSFKTTVGYKLSPRFAAGLGGKLYYDLFNQPQGFEDFSFFSYGPLAYAKGRIFDNFYAVAEYNYTNFEYINVNFIDRDWRGAPLVGGEYMSGVGQWRYGAQLLFVLDGVYRDLNANGIVDWWFYFRYNF